MVNVRGLMWWMTSFFTNMYQCTHLNIKPAKHTKYTNSCMQCCHLIPSIYRLVWSFLILSFRRISQTLRQLIISSTTATPAIHYSPLACYQFLSTALECMKSPANSHTLLRHTRGSRLICWRSYRHIETVSKAAETHVEIDFFEFPS